eukprot:CAMPEP_0116899116 /NCGR_PEP_ID=MMETSP0467-20121206/7743_1 /TAXON_ID=283647 /ORGANISM="Mesodinium pulex, Strain SPMC105" /LENGTH=86 /DNA_ID=CAMNT_0004571731 /DNA_START=914 /DNA_END=1174 /DNA_ORIENTATION=-
MHGRKFRPTEIVEGPGGEHAQQLNLMVRSWGNESSIDLSVNVVLQQVKNYLGEIDKDSRDFEAERMHFIQYLTSSIFSQAMKVLEE